MYCCCRCCLKLKLNKIKAWKYIGGIFVQKNVVVAKKIMKILLSMYIGSFKHTILWNYSAIEKMAENTSKFIKPYQQLRLKSFSFFYHRLNFFNKSIMVKVDEYNYNTFFIMI